MILDIPFVLEHIPDFIRAVGVTFEISGIVILTSFVVATVNSAIPFFQTASSHIPGSAILQKSFGQG